MMNKGKRHLKNKTYELKEFSRLKKNVEKKKLQLQKDINEYKNSIDPNEEKISAYEDFQAEAKDLLKTRRKKIGTTKGTKTKNKGKHTGKR